MSTIELMVDGMSDVQGDAASDTIAGLSYKK